MTDKHMRNPELDVDPAVIDQMATADYSAGMGGVEPIPFKHIEDYTTFNAEWSEVDDDLVFHFFLTPEISARTGWRKYWEVDFPTALDPAAQEVFQATFPRLQAQFVTELNSWWLRAFGFGRISNPEVYVDALLKELDKRLEAMTLK